MAAAAARQRYKTPRPLASTFVAVVNSDFHILSTRNFYDLQPSSGRLSGFRERYTMFKYIKPNPKRQAGSRFLHTVLVLYHGAGQWIPRQLAARLLLSL